MRSAVDALLDAYRSLRAAGSTTAFILIVLTLGISAGTVTFSVVDAIVLRPLPFERAGELVVVESRDDVAAAFHVTAASPAQYLALGESVEAFQSLGAARRGSLALSHDGVSEPLTSAGVTASLFDTLRVRPIVGETFTRAHESRGQDRVAVIGYDLWQRAFGGDPSIVGRSVQAADGPLVVLGVMPQGFAYPVATGRQTRVEIWTPYVMSEAERSGADQSRYLHVVGRLRSGTSLETAQEQANAVARSFAARSSPERGVVRFRAVPLLDALLGPVRGWMLLVLAAVGLVMLVACVNVANLLLTRAVYRSRELSIRAALGATRRQLLASLLLESLLLSLAASALGVLAALWGVDVAKSSLPEGIARAETIALDLRVLAAAIGAAIVTALLFGAVPAFEASRQDVGSLMKQGGVSVSLRRRRWRAMFLVAEVAFVSVLLVATALVSSSFIRIVRADLGFDRSNLLVVSGLSRLQGTPFSLLEPVQHLRGVTAAATVEAGSPPLVAAGFGGGASSMSLRRDDAPGGPAVVEAEYRRVSPGYFRATGIPIIRGRSFDAADQARKDVVLLDVVAAQRLFADGDAVGRVIGRGDDRLTVVGIVGNVLMRGPERASGPQAYFPASTTAAGSLLVVRTSRPVSEVIPHLQGLLQERRPAQSRPAEIRLVSDAFRNITADRRFNAGLMSMFGVLALLIGAAGVYGVMASIVAQQTRELAVRVALGARAGQLVGAVLVQAGRYLAVGLALGLVIAWWISTGFASLLFGVHAHNPAAYASVAVILLTVGLAAALVPARRAARVDPLVTLRSE